MSPAGTILLSMAVAAIVITLAGPADAGLAGFLGKVGTGGIRRAPKKA